MAADGALLVGLEVEAGLERVGPGPRADGASAATSGATATSPAVDDDLGAERAGRHVRGDGGRQPRKVPREKAATARRQAETLAHANGRTGEAEQRDQQRAAEARALEGGVDRGELRRVARRLQVESRPADREIRKEIDAEIVEQVAWSPSGDRRNRARRDGEQEGGGTGTTCSVIISAAKSR